MIRSALTTLPPRWFLPTYHGDIRLEPLSPKQTKLTAEALTPSEEQAIEKLRRRALKEPLLSAPWSTPDRFKPLSEQPKGGFVLVLDAPIESVQSFLARALKPDRTLVSVVKFESGRMEEVWREEPKPAAEGYREPSPAVDPPAAPAAIEKAAPAEVKKKPDPPKAAATVAQPVRGCPLPEFGEAEIRATRVLETFLSPEQLDDYRRHGRFVETGRETGHRYLLTLRELAQHQSHVSFRSLYDLDEQEPLCVHDWDVPSPEELLGLAVFLRIAGGEPYLRSMPPVH